MNELKVGDEILSYSGWEKEILIAIYKIQHVTKAHAISGKMRFRKEYSDNGNIRAVGQPARSRNRYLISTPEKKAEAIAARREQNTLDFLSYFKWDTIPPEKRQRIIAIIKEPETQKTEAEGLQTPGTQGNIP